MGKIKTWKNADEATPQQLHRVLDSSIKKKKDSKFKNTPTSMVALINKSKDKYASSQKDSTGTKSHNQKQSRQGSLNGKQAHPSKVEREEAIQTGTTCTMREMEDDSSSSEDNNPLAHNVSTDDMSEDDLDTDRPSLRMKPNDESDEEEIEEDEEDYYRYGTPPKHFEGKSSKTAQLKTTKNDEKDQEEDDEDSSDDDEDSSYDEDGCLTFGSEEDTDEDLDEEEDQEDGKGKKEDKNKEEDCDSDCWYGVRYIKKIGKKRILLEEPDDMNDEDDYSSDMDWNEFEAEDDDDLNESELGLRTLLGDTIVDDDDDEDFNGEDEDEDDDDDTSSEGEDDEEEDSDEVKKTLAAKKKKADEASSKKRNTQVRKDEENKDKRIVLVDNISRHITEDEVKELFGPYGEILQIQLKPFPEFLREKKNKNMKQISDMVTIVYPKLNTRMANLLYKTEESASNAVKNLHGKKFDGRYLNVVTAYDAAQEPEEGKSVYIKNLRPGTPDNAIWKLFRKCGHIKRLKLERDLRSGLIKGYGYVCFNSEEAAKNALELNGIDFIGEENIYVEPYKSKKRESGQKDEKQGTKRVLSHKDNKPSKKFKNISGEHTAHNIENEKNVKKSKKGDNKGNESTAFQGQKVDLKNKKKKSKLDFKKKKMAEKLTAKSAKV